MEKTQEKDGLNIEIGTGEVFEMLNEILTGDELQELQFIQEDQRKLLYKHPFIVHILANFKNQNHLSCRLYFAQKIVRALDPYYTDYICKGFEIPFDTIADDVSKGFKEKITKIVECNDRTGFIAIMTWIQSNMIKQLEAYVSSKREQYRQIEQLDNIFASFSNEYQENE